MISFKHILVTFTILSVSIWFGPVISPNTEPSSSSSSVTSITLQQKLGMAKFIHNQWICTIIFYQQ